MKKGIALLICVGIIIVVASAFTAEVGISSIASEPSDTELIEETGIEKLQQRIYEQGYNYTVAENWITHLSPEDIGALCGYKPLEAPEEAPAENVGFFYHMPKIKIEAKKLESLPSSYDAMALGYVTPVKNQHEPHRCSSCWIFGAVANFESAVTKNESILFDFSEQEVGDCNIWSRAGGHNFCEEGNSLMSTNYLTKYGSADETCAPYVAEPQTCRNCTILKNVDNWRIITGSHGESEEAVATIKNAILNYGPVATVMYASDPGFLNYSGGVYEYWGPEHPNHLVLIIGWNDTLKHSHGTGAWLIKNSWGTSWGASGPYPGCAWVAYGAANIGDFTNAIASYKNPGDEMFYHDECGWMLHSFGYNTTTAYGAVRFIPEQDAILTAVDFWAVDAMMTYEIKIFDTLNDLGDNYTFSNTLGTTQVGITNEPGYYSIPLDTPVQLVSGDDFFVQVKLTTLGSGYQIPIDYCGESWLNWSSIATFSGESYVSCDGSQFEKPFIPGVGYVDIGIRARAEIPHHIIWDTRQPENPYPSIFGTYNGTITPNRTIYNISRLYTYPCSGTGGHSEYAAFYNATTGEEIANGTWNGYQGAGDYHYMEFNVSFDLQANVTYNYTIHTGSYPQIYHKPALRTANGWINCTKFIDANGKTYTDWIPAIRLESTTC